MKDIPPAFKHLMQQCWESLAKNRPSFKEILRILESLPASDFYKLPAGYFFQRQGLWGAEIKKQFVMGDSAMKKHASLLGSPETDLPDQTTEAAMTSRERSQLSRTGAKSRSSSNHGGSQWKRDSMTI
jgi:hypothetical protein